MNELAIKVNYESDKPTVSGRELHEKLGIKTAYKDWFPRMCEYGFAEGEDFNTLKNDLGYDELNFAFKVEEYTGIVPSDIITNPELNDATTTFDSIPVGTPFHINNDTVNKNYVISELGFKLPGTYTVTSKDYSVLSGKLDFTKKVTEDYPESITLNLEMALPIFRIASQTQINYQRLWR